MFVEGATAASAFALGAGAGAKNVPKPDAGIVPKPDGIVPNPEVVGRLPARELRNAAMASSGLAFGAVASAFVPGAGGVASTFVPGGAGVASGTLTGEWSLGVTWPTFYRKGVKMSRIEGNSVSASEQRGNNLKRVKDFYLKAEARFWPRLSCMCHICLTAERDTPVIQLEKSNQPP